MDPITRESFEKLLFERVCLPAILDQAKADRDAGKVLTPKMEVAVNIYSQILANYPGSASRGAAK